MKKNKYNSGQIYRIFSFSNPEISFIGSTVQTLNKRLAIFKRQFKNFQKTGKNYNKVFSILEYSDNSIGLIEAFPCNSKMELIIRERYYIQQLQCVNKQIAGRKYKKKYYKKCLANQPNCECGGNYKIANKSKHFKTKKHLNFINNQAIQT